MKEFVSKLREKADIFAKSGCASDGIVKDYKEAADMIEGLSKKLASAKTNSNGMKEFVEKLIERLEEKSFIRQCADNKFHSFINIDKIKNTINQLAEEYNPSKSSSLAEQIADDLISKKLLIEKMWEKHKETEEMYDIWTADDIKDIFCGIVAMIDELPIAYNQDSTKNNQGWIPVAERLPEYKGEYLITTNFGVTSALYLPNSKKWVDTIEQYFEYSCVAWQPLPEPYKPEQQKEIPTEHFTERFNRVV